MSDKQLDGLLQTAMRAARAGGELALARREDPGYQKWKGPRDLQAGAVLDIQQRIVDVIRADLPDAKFLVEESDEPQDEPAERLWIIDPIDGSLNFFQGFPLFAVCVGYRVEGRYQVGVVYDPCNNELFHATFGQGAYLNDSPIIVEKFSEGQEAYQRALVGTDWPGSIEDRKTALYISRILGNEVTQLWTLGCPALGLCYVAAGRLHAYYYYSLQLKLWDLAAASVILQEAGGVLTDIMGGSWLFAEGGYLATNGVIHGAMLRTIKPLLEIKQMQQSRT